MAILVAKIAMVAKLCSGGSGVDRRGSEGAKNSPVELNCSFVGKPLVLSEI